MTNVAIDGSLYTISNLGPGDVYDCYASSDFCGHTSARSEMVKEFTGLCENFKYY